MRKLFFGLIVGFSFTLRSLAWNAEGHMVVAQLAYNHLDSVVKTRCDALLAVPLANASAGTSNFVSAAVWADDFKTALGTGIWHYLDIPFSLDGTATNGVSTASFDVVRAINQCIATLQNTNAAATNRATCLRYLLHFVGDIQQPLHCCTAVYVGKTTGDSGGNGFTLTGATWSNLHSLWDDGGGFLGDTITRPFTTNSFATLSNKVVSVETNYPFIGHPGTIPDPMTWAVEGKNLGQSNCYVGITRGSTPSTNYLDAASALAKARLALGGQRICSTPCSRPRPSRSRHSRSPVIILFFRGAPRPVKPTASNGKPNSPPRLGMISPTCSLLPIQRATRT
jgi:hypothetical protein